MVGGSDCMQGDIFHLLMQGLDGKVALREVVIEIKLKLMI